MSKGSVDAVREVCDLLDTVLVIAESDRAPMRGVSLLEQAARSCWMTLIKAERDDPSEDRRREMKPPNSRERQVMQYLRGAGWVKATGMPDSPNIIANLIGKGWVECQQTDAGPVYRLTNLGLAAKKAPLGAKREGRVR